jgi:hypothetical protein
VTVEGVVTTSPGLLDSADERVALQDANGALLLRLPEGITVSVGQRVRASGEMGTYYGAPQLSAAGLTVLGQGQASATSVASAPIAPGLEWRLVTISGTVESVRRDGDAWRAELLVSGGGIPISGIDRAGIPSTALEEGRRATITGIVKRAYPTASDQRLAIVPRNNGDITLGDAVPASGGGNPASSPGSSGNDNPGAPQSSQPQPGASGGDLPDGPNVNSPAPDGPAAYVRLEDLEQHVGSMVRVGATVVRVSGVTLTIDDGTGIAAVRLARDAATLGEQLRPNDLVNVVGSVVRTATGSLEVLVEDAAGLIRQAAPGGSPATSSASSQVASASGNPGPITSNATAAGAADRAPAIVAALLLGLAAAVIGAVTVAGPARRQRLLAGANRLIGRQA